MRAKLITKQEKSFMKKVHLLEEKSRRQKAAASKRRLGAAGNKPFQGLCKPRPMGVVLTQIQSVLQIYSIISVGSPGRLCLDSMPLYISPMQGDIPQGFVRRVSSRITSKTKKPP